MNFRDAQIGIEVFSRYTCGQNRDWGDEENRKIPIGGCFEFAYEKCFVSLPRTTNAPDLTAEDRQQLEDAGWFFDEDHEVWCHH